MSRLYYDCPIKAAYMAKEFGVKFESVDDGEKFIIPIEDITCYYAPLYIHPDSEHIFKPQEGDFVLEGDGDGYLIPSDCADLYQHDEILKRNNTSFITPEREA